MNVDQVARRVLGAAAGATDAGLVLVAAWVSQRYQELSSRGYLRHLRRLGEIVVPPVVTAGTVTVTAGSQQVTGDATAVAAWTAAIEDPLDVDGWYIRPVTTWLEVEGVDLPNSRLLLKSPYTDATQTSTYRLCHRFLPVDESARWLGEFVHMRRRRPIGRRSIQDLDTLYPDRHQLGGGGPWLVAETALSALGKKRVEFYPYVERAELVNYVFWEIPPELSLDDEIPSGMQWDVLLEGALVDLYRYNATQAARNDKTDAAAYWRNEYRAQETRWEKKIAQGLRTEAGVDDVTMILETIRSSTMGVRDITSARDVILDRWPL